MPCRAVKSKMTQHNILVIDSDSKALSATGRILENSQYNVSLAENGHRGIVFLNSESFALVLMDFSLEDTTALQVLQTVRDTSPETMIVLQGKPVDAAFMKAMFALNADDCIFKPYQPEELLYRVRKNIETHELKRRIKLRKSFFSSCCVCKKIRIDDYGPPNDRWMEVEDFLKEEMDILLSSTYCPKCAQTVQEDLLVQIDRLNA